MELVDGTSLRDIIESRPMAVKKLLSIAAQAADGLAAAHEKGIVHRDLKPENLMVDRSGRVKILDFGLAKLVLTPSASAEDATVSLAEKTSEGTILGTVGYMSPEQASGKQVDFRSDQFSLGAIVYEMATGRRAFRGATPVETLSSVIRDDPSPIPEAAPGAPAPLVWAIDRCLAKDPSERYGSTRDLARDFANLRDHVGRDGSSPSVSAGPAEPKGVSPRWAARVVVAAAAAVAAAGLAFLAGSRTARREAPTFERITFRRGTIVSARFAPGGDSIVYGARWEGKPLEIFSTRGSGMESRSLGITNADILSISRSGEMAISVNRRVLGGFLYTGTLARADLSGGAPREILENVSEADWTPDGKELAVSKRSNEGGYELDLPAEKRLFSTPGWISHPRVSPKGDLVAFIHHPVPGDDRGEIMVVDRAGKTHVLSGGWGSAQGLAWRPDGREVWFTSALGTNRYLNAVSLAGKTRLVDQMAASLVLQDISPAGRVLLTRVDLPVNLFVESEGAASEVNLTWLDASIVHDISPDGKVVTFTEAGDGGGPYCSVYVRRVDEPYATRLGDGWAEGLSPDGKSVLAIDPSKATGLVIYPVGPGASRRIEHPGIGGEQWAAWLPGGQRIVFAGRETGHGVKIYVQDLAGRQALPITPEGVGVFFIESPYASLSPDGRRVAVDDPAGVLTLYSLEGEAPKTVPGARSGEGPVGWGSDGRSLFVSGAHEIPARVVRIALDSGARTPFKDLSPSDPAGVQAVDPVVLAPDGKAYAYSCLLYLSNLYVGEGLR
jgi:Tol biopolymer transport system component